MGLSIGVDIGGTKIAAGVVDEHGTILAKERVSTPATDTEAIADAVAEAVKKLATDHDVTAVGIGAAGFVDENRKVIRFAPNISWVDEPLADHVSRRVDLPVIVENDANAATWGEFRFGAGKDVQDLLMITVGTGIGGGIVAGGSLYRGAFGIAGEVGHMRTVPGGVQCGCGQQGCWEQYASGKALVREAIGRIDAAMEVAKPLLAAVDGDRDKIDGPLITTMAQDEDPMCLDLLGDAGRWLGEGIASLGAVLDPATVVIGGGVAAAGDLLLGPLRMALARHLPARAHRPEMDVRLATLGNDAGMCGAADLARGSR